MASFVLPRILAQSYCLLDKDTRMKTRLKRWAILITGWAFILLGIVGLFLPILQGILFLLIGLLLLSTEYVWAHHLLAKLRARFPKLNQQFEKAAAHSIFRKHGVKIESPNGERKQSTEDCEADSKTRKEV